MTPLKLIEQLKCGLMESWAKNKLARFKQYA